jgi:acetyl-CoA C-acetyltransferase
MLAQQGIQTGDIDIAVAGGMESMSNCRYILRRCVKACGWARLGRRSDDPRRPMVPVRELAHGQRRRDRRRRLQGHAGAAGSVFGRQPQEGGRGTGCGKFDAEILPVPIPQKKGDPIIFNKRRIGRADTTAEVLRGLKPAFKKDGSVTRAMRPA